jgi:hypothetical protein
MLLRISRRVESMNGIEADPSLARCNQFIACSLPALARTVRGPVGIFSFFS